jgi:hypothetical protein
LKYNPCKGLKCLLRPQQSLFLIFSYYILSCPNNQSFTNYKIILARECSLGD